MTPVWPHTFVSLSADSRGVIVSYWQKNVHEVLVSRLGGLSLPRKSVVRLTDHPDMTLDVYCERKTTTQQQCSSCADNDLLCGFPYASFRAIHVLHWVLSPLGCLVVLG